MGFRQFFSQAFSLAGTFCLVAILAHPALAQQLTISGSPTTVGDADEYFTDVQQNPKDFDSTCDIGFDGWAMQPESAVNGVWTGQHLEQNAPVLGFLPIPTTGTNLAVYREDCASLGLHAGKQIDTSKYTGISWKMKNSFPSSFSVMWTKDENYALKGFADYDGFFLPGGGVPTGSNAWVIYDFSLPGRQPSDFPWSGSVTGMSLWPTFSQTAGGTVSFDWIRIYDPNTSATFPINWSWNGSVGNNDSVTLYVDTDNSGFDGIGVQRFLSTSGSTNVQSGFLAPGTYYFYVELVTHNGFTPTTLQRSSYIGPYVVNGKPTFQFTAPSRYSGPEYSRDEAGNPWDMNDAADVINLTDANGNPTPEVFRGIENGNFSNGIFTADTITDPVGFTVDSQVHFNVPAGKPVNTNFYRWFCYRMQVDPQHLSRNGDPVVLNAAGWVARFIWSRNSGTDNFGSTKAHELVERSNSYPDFDNGMVTYCFDLWDDEGHESGKKWRDMQFADVARFDPLEAMPSTSFAIDWAGLFAENRDTNDSYLIQWEAQDPENENLSISFFYDTDNSGFNGTLIANINGQAVGTGSYLWETTGVADGTYYIYAVVSDGTTSNRIYTDVTVTVGATEGLNPSPPRTPCDFDGDGKTDISIIRGDATTNAGTVFRLSSSNGAISTHGNGDVSLDAFVDADVDGDRISDLGFSRARLEPSVRWFYQLSTTTLTNAYGWGLLGDIPVPNDYDGDNIDDIAVYRPADGNWFVIPSAGGTQQVAWGLNGDIPVPEDYDGDGKADIAVFRPSIGFWFGLQSSRSNSSDVNDLVFKQWGLPGDKPMPGDYDGDGKADLMVFRPSFGFWLMCASRTNYDCSQGTIVQFGLPEDIPIKGDFDGDGTLDLALWRPSSGHWFYKRSSDGVIIIIQFGLPGDQPYCADISHTVDLVN